MAVGLKIDFLWYSIGSPDFLHSFFQQFVLILKIQIGEVGFQH